jgi:hypothetical protein
MGNLPPHVFFPPPEGGRKISWKGAREEEEGEKEEKGGVGRMKRKGVNSRSLQKPPSPPQSLALSKPLQATPAGHPIVISRVLGVQLRAL